MEQLSKLEILANIEREYSANPHLVGQVTSDTASLCVLFWSKIPR